MAEEKQKIKTVLIPEDGLSLSPSFVQESLVDTDFIRSFAHLVGKTPSGTILIKASSDGSLRVVSAGVPFELYVVNSGISVDGFHADDTFEFTTAYNVTDFFIETHPAIISFKDHADFWLPEKILPVGMHSIDIINYGIRIRNRTPGSNCVYEITSYR